VLFLSVWLTCVYSALEMDTFLLTATLPLTATRIHISRHATMCFSLLSVLKTTKFYSNWLISDPSMSHFENTILDGIRLLVPLRQCRCRKT
jgi:hypothetical protein